jgi:hypothetical protein
MFNKYPSSDCTSADFEKEALQRFRRLANCIPPQCQILREPWGSSTVLCLDFQNCPHLWEDTKEQSDRLVKIVQELALAQSILFRMGKKVIGWTRITH